MPVARMEEFLGQPSGQIFSARGGWRDLERAIRRVRGVETMRSRGKTHAQNASSELGSQPRRGTPRRTTTPGGDASIVGVTLTEESNNPRGGRTGRSCGGGRRARGVEPADSLTGPLRGGGRASPPRRRADDLLAEAHRSRAVRCDKPGDDVSAVWRCPSVSAQFLEFQLESFEWVGRLHFWPRKKHGTSHQAGASSSNRCLARARDGGRGRARWRGREEEEKER